MKTSSILKTAFFAAGFSAFTLIGNTSAAPVINVKLTPGPDGGGYVYNLDGTASNTSTVAPIGYSGTTWNDVASQSGSSLLTSTGGSSNVGFNLTGNVVAYSGNSAGNPGSASNIVMLQGAYVTNTTLTLSLTGLTDGIDYNLALVGFYGPGGGNAHYGGSFTVGAQTLSDTGFDTTVTSDTFVAGPGAGSDYVEFTNLLSSGGDITVTIAPAAGQTYGILNGFQIQAETPVEVPEPSTYALMGLGALALLVVSRRRKA